MVCCNIFEKFGSPNNVLKEYKYWKILLDPNQLTLGCCILILNRHIEMLSDMEKTEFYEMKDVKKEVENALIKAFRSNRVEYDVSCTVEDPHWRLRVIPRYEREKSFAGILWKDKDWPKPPSMGSEVPELDPQIIEKIKLEIYHNLM